MKKILTIITSLLLAFPLCAKELTPAFPGAEGFGRYVTGGRGGAVYHVTTLSDGTQEGTLRWAINKSGVRTIVFDVSGTIHLTSALTVRNGNVTIAGQTAPGDGICVADYPVSLRANNIIVRYMRFRLGNKHVLIDGADGWDGFGGFDAQDWMIDHCSVSWSIDECLSVLGNKNTTVQWCISAQSLVNSGHTKGAHGYGGNWGGNHASFHHNLIIHHTSRTPRLGPRPTTQMNEYMDMRNNVMYNYGSNGCYGGEGMRVNIVNNYYKPGPGSATNTKGKRIAGIGIRTTEYITTYPDYAPAWHVWGKFYVDGNYNDKFEDVYSNNWENGMYNQIDNASNDNTFTQTTKDTMRLSAPLDIIYTTTHKASQAYNRVLDYVGASLHRDSHDRLMVSDCENGKATYTGNGLGKGFINSQDDMKPAGAGEDWSAWPALESKPAPNDSDGDGIPDEWETAHGLNPNDANDGKTVATEEGYTNLEVYMNSIVAHITEAQNAGGTIMGGIKEEGQQEGSEYHLNASTCSSESGDLTYVFDGGFSITNTASKGYAVSNKTNYIKYSTTQYTIHLPEDVMVSSVKIEGFDNYGDADSYLGELNGETLPSDLYVWPRKKDDGSSVITTRTIPLSSPAIGTLTFTPKGKQVCWAITLVDNPTGIEEIALAMPTKKGAYTIGGMKLNAIPSKRGIYILNGKKYAK